MPAFIEAEAQHKLWAWLESEGHEVYAEVPIDAGRIDLVSVTSNQEVWGIEVKGVGISLSDIAQVDRYVRDDALDKVYLTSCSGETFAQLTGPEQFNCSVGYDESYAAASGAHQLIQNGVAKQRIVKALEEREPRSTQAELADGQTITEWMDSLPDLGWPSERYDTIAMEDPTVERVVNTFIDPIEWYDSAHEAGVIDLRTDIEQLDKYSVTITERCRKLLDNEPPDMTVLREPTRRERTTMPEDTHTEIDLQHTVWVTYDELAEAALPNHVTEHNNTINIDFIRFEGGSNAVDILNNGGEVIGIEIKTASGLSDEQRLREQIRKYAATGALNRLYVAVPSGYQDYVDAIIESIETLDVSDIGLILIEENSCRTIRDGTKMELRYDAYGSEEYPYHIGYGNAAIPAVAQPASIYTGDAEAE